MILNQNTQFPISKHTIDYSVVEYHENMKPINLFFQVHIVYASDLEINR